MGELPVLQALHEETAWGIPCFAVCSSSTQIYKKIISASCTSPISAAGRLEPLRVIQHQQQLPAHHRFHSEHLRGEEYSSSSTSANTRCSMACLMGCMCSKENDKDSTKLTDQKASYADMAEDAASMLSETGKEKISSVAARSSDNERGRGEGWRGTGASGVCDAVLC